MRTLLLLILILIPSTPIIAGEGDSSTPVDGLVRRLLGADAEDRAAARREILAAGADRLPALLDAIERRVSNRLPLVDLRDVRTGPDDPEDAGFDNPRNDPAPVLELYDVRDLLTASRSLEDLIHEIGSPGPGATVSAKGDSSLAVKGPPAAQARVKEVLSGLREQAKGWIHATVRLVRRPAAPDAAPSPDAPPEGPRLLAPGELEEILAAAPAGPGGQGALAPRITTWSGQRANLSMLRDVSYIQDFDIEVGQGQFIADPI